MRREAVAQRMQRDRLAYTGGLNRLMEQTIELARRQVTVFALAWKQIAFWK